MKIMNYDLFNDIYESWVDEIISMPLVRPRLTSNRLISNRLTPNRFEREYTVETDRNLVINQDVISQMYNLRRNLEILDLFLNRRNINRRNSTYLIDSETNVFDTFLEAFLDTHILQQNAVQTSEELQDVKVTLSDNQFSQLPKFDKSLIKESTNCSVCLEDYDNNDSLIKLPCNHVFHNDCIKNWLCNEKVTCPVCRMDVRDGLKLTG